MKSAYLYSSMGVPLALRVTPLDLDLIESTTRLQEHLEVLLANRGAQGRVQGRALVRANQVQQLAKVYLVLVQAFSN